MQNRRDVASGFLQRLSDPGYRHHDENPAAATLAGQKFAERAEPQVTRAITDTDIILLEMQISRFQQETDYWKIRATELAGTGRRGGSA